jgi:hypothetical protein
MKAAVKRKRAILRELRAVTVLPDRRRGNGFDPDSVLIELRQP